MSAVRIPMAGEPITLLSGQQGQVDEALQISKCYSAFLVRTALGNLAYIEHAQYLPEGVLWRELPVNKTE